MLKPIGPALADVVAKANTSREAAMEEAIAAVITALDVPRNRMGKLDGDCASSEPLRELAVRYQVPGARDSAEQAVLVLRAVLYT